MKLLFDQNISYRILRALPAIFEGSSHVKRERLIDFPDAQIWEFAKKNGYSIVTQDSDFNALNLLYGHPPKIIWIRSGNLSTTSIVDILVEQFNEIESFILDSRYGCLEITKGR